MPGAPDLPIGSPLAHLLGNFGGAFGNSKEDFSCTYTVPEGDCTYTVPEGCIVRNTFLEWQDHSEPGVYSRGGDSVVCPHRALKPSRPRAHSCPHRPLARTSAAAKEPSQRAAGDCGLRPAMSAYSFHEVCSGTSDSFEHAPMIAKGCSLSADDVTAMACGAMVGGMNYGFYHAADPHELYCGVAPHGPDFLDGQQEDPIWYGGGWMATPTTAAGGPGTGSGGGGSDWSPDSDESSGQQDTGHVSASEEDAPLVLRGLPYTVTEGDLVAFLEEAGVIDALARSRPISLLTNPRGKPSGFAEIRLRQHANFWEVQEKLHMRSLGGRYIEALPPRSGKASSWPAGPSWKRLPTPSRPAAKRAAWRRF